MFVSHPLGHFFSFFFLSLAIVALNQSTFSGAIAVILASHCNYYMEISLSLRAIKISLIAKLELGILSSPASFSGCRTEAYPSSPPLMNSVYYFYFIDCYIFLLVSSVSLWLYMYISLGSASKMVAHLMRFSFNGFLLYHFEALNCDIIFFATLAAIFGECR